MFGFEAAELYQLVAGIGGAALFAAFVQAVPERWSIAVLLCLVPFQFVESRYGTGNMGITYVAAAIFLIQGRLRRLPLILPVFLVFLVYGISLTQSPRITWSHHILYLVGLFPAYLMFYMAYNFIRRNPDPDFVSRILVFVNVLVVIFCFLQIVLGPSMPHLFSISKLSQTLSRLEGPFHGSHFTTEFLVIQVILTTIILLRSRQQAARIFLRLLLSADIAIIFMAGDRGGFFALVAGVMLFAFLYRKELGMKRIAIILIGSSIVFVAAGFVATKYTKYDVLYDRLARTSVEGGIPDTRAKVWSLVAKRIPEAPIIGHGPKLRVVTHYNYVEGIRYMPYPHNLVLHLLFTVGIVGLLAYTLLFSAFTYRMLAGARTLEPGSIGSDAGKVGLIVMAVFMLSEFRVEFLRANATDMQQYLFFLFGTIIAYCDYGRQRSTIRSQTARKIEAPVVTA